MRSREVGASSNPAPSSGALSSGVGLAELGSASRGPRTDPGPDSPRRPSRLDVLDEKVRLALALVETLPEGSRRRNLLHTAVLRRDELLLDGLLAELKK